MEDIDIDMVISIPDTPDRPVRHREVKRRPNSPEPPLRYQREEYRNYLSGRTRPVPEIGDNRESSDTRTENGHHRVSGGNALFRRTVVEQDKGKSISTDPRGARVEKNPVLNLNQRNGHAHVAASRCLPFEDIRELRTSNGCSPLRGDHNSFMLPGTSNKGKEKADSASVSNRETIDLSSGGKQQNRGTKRLVRHGCISPNGIAARARQAADTNSKDTVSVEQELAPETASSISIREIVSENDIHGRARGKRPEISCSRVASRDGSEGWVSTRNRKLNMDQELNQRDESDARGICSSVSRLDVHETGVVEREARQQRRRKNGFTTSTASNEAEVTVIRSSGEPSSSRPPRIQNHLRHGTQVLEIEDSSPEVRVFRGPRRVENNVSDVNVRQMEADEILARELQEQLYQEETLIRHQQIDENIARLLEQEENSRRASSSRSSSTRSTRNSNTIAANRGGRSRLEARLQQHSSRRRLNPPQARAPVRAPTRGRGYRLGRASASLHTALNLSFPYDMGIETRMDLLEGLENAIGHSITTNSLLHMDRDFTEDDYELLLALDENNHRHGGASAHRINNLPESTVQNDNFQETCVICLETPKIGDTIRHLPCLHKFHKDCIDPWLGRSKSCPVCKSSVT
ncbi:Zinc finger RING-type [Arabidopsis suecica]|uniref:Zinc finger RING-type n=1 Tax=Arabidopsis suecica TaxID=45249 RepID=A0A8T2GZZ5_ARASU|nr:Zinc finger RING-type [Arabidopsis suecica]